MKKILFCLFIFGLIAMMPNVSASGEGWLDGWDHRQGITIIGSSGAGTNYQVLLNVTYDSNMQADFDDLRITDASGVTELDYWIESYIASTNASVWVEVAANLNSNQVIYMYWGNDAVSTTSDGDDTFNLFSDFNRFMDLDSWDRYSSSDDYVFADDVDFGTVDTIGKAEGLAYDGEFYYIATYNYSAGGSESWLYKVNNAFEIVDSEELTDGTLTHSGGICLYNGHLYVAMAEPVQNPVNPSKLKRYSAADLSYVDTLIDSSDYGDDHWGGVVIISSLDRLYVVNWGVTDLYVFQIDGTYVTTITSPPDINIQDMVYIENDNLLYGSKTDGSDNIISVWRPDGIGNSLTKVGEIMTSTDRTKNGFTWYDGYFYTGVAEPDDFGDVYLRKLQGADNELTILDYYIYNDTLIGPDLMFEANVKIGGNMKFNMGWSATIPTAGTQIILHNSDGNINIYEGNADDDTGFDIEQDTWTTLGLGWTEGHATAFKNRGSKHQTDDVDITGDSLKPQITLWGSADTPIYVSWVFIRNWVLVEPIVIFGVWNELDPASLVFSVGFDMWGMNTALIILGLVMIPTSTIYLAYGAKHDRSSDRLFYGLILFMLGCGLFIGGVLP